MSFLSDSILKALAAHVAKTLGNGVTEAKVLAAIKAFKVPSTAASVPTKVQPTAPVEDDEDASGDVEEEEATPPSKPKPKTAAKATATAKGGKGAAAPSKSKAAAPAKSADEKHTCEYMVKGDNPHVCGKTGKTTEFEGMWYCGTEKSGHLSSVMKATEKVVKKPTAPSVLKKAAAKATVPSKAEPKKEKLNLVTVGDYFIYPKNRIAFKKGTRIAVGILDKDNVKLKPLDAEAIRFCESRNLETAAKSTKPAPASKAPAKAGAPASKAPVKAAAPAATKSKAGAKTSAKPKVTEEEVDLGEEAPETEEVAEAAEEDVAEEQVDIQLGDEGEEEPDVEEETEPGAEEEAEEGEEEEEGEGAEEEGEGVEEGEGGDE